MRYTMKQWFCGCILIAILIVMFHQTTHEVYLVSRIEYFEAPFYHFYWMFGWEWHNPSIGSLLTNASYFEMVVSCVETLLGLVVCGLIWFIFGVVICFLCKETVNK